MVEDDGAFMTQTRAIPSANARAATRTAAMLVAIMLAAVACSSTNRQAREAEPGQSPAGPDLVGSGDPVPGSSADASASAIPSVPFVSSSTGPAPKTSGGIGIDLSPGRGVKGNKISIGAFEIENRAEFIAAFGVKGLQGVDARKAQDAIVKYLNANGGLGGRAAVPRYHSLDATSTDTYAALAQAACEDFTRDREVFAVVAGTIDSARCLADGDVITINDADAAGDETFIKGLGKHYYRKAKAWVEGLAELGFLSKSKHYGLVYYDVPGMPRSIARSLDPALKKHGVSIATDDRIEIHWPDSTPDAGATIAEIQNAVLRFKSRDVTHVLLYDVNGTITTFFLRQADSQEYTPFYGLESDSHLEFQNLNVPHRQLAKAVAVGWRHQEDVTNAKPANASERLCLDILRKAAVELPDVGSTAQAIMLCDMWFFLKAGFDAAPAPNVDGFRLGVEGLGQRFLSPRTYVTRFARGRTPDGVAATRNVAYRMSCECWELKGKLRSLP